MRMEAMLKAVNQTRAWPVKRRARAKLFRSPLSPTETYNPNMHIETFPVGLLQCNCTIAADTERGEAIVIDPGDEITRIVERLAALRVTLRQILITHAHIDHVGGALQLKRLTGAPILMHEDDLPLLRMMEIQAGWLGVETPETAPPDEALRESKVVGLTQFPATVLHTPGHTPGSVCLHFANQGLLLAGDTLFAGSIGRTDLPGGDGRRILESIHGKLLQLPEETKVIAGHGATTTIGEERLRNPFLRLV